MFSKTFLAAAFAAVVAAQSNSDNPTTAPATGEVVSGCAPYTLKWTPTTSGTVSIDIISGASQGTLVPVGRVATGIANSGSFVWTPEAALGANAVTGYKIFDDATGQFQYSVPFSVDGTTCDAVVTPPVDLPEASVPEPVTTPVAPAPEVTDEPEDSYPTTPETTEAPVAPVVPSSSLCTTTSTVYVNPPSTAYPTAPAYPVVPSGAPYPIVPSGAPYPVVPPTTLYPTAPLPSGTGAVGYPSATPPAQEFPGAASSVKAGLGLVGAAAAFIFML